MPTSVPPSGNADIRNGAYFAPLSVTAQDTPNLTVNIRAGSYWSSNTGQFIEYNGGTSPVIPPPLADARWTLIYLDSTGVLEILHSVTNINPQLPAPPDDSLPLAGIYMTAISTAITPNSIYDVRPYVKTNNNIDSIQLELDNKADVTGTPSPTFTLYDCDLDLTTNVSLEVNRGPNLARVSIRWNMTLNRWEYTNDGVNFSPLGAVSLALDDLTDVVITSPVQGQGLIYSPTGTWVNGTVSAVTSVAGRIGDVALATDDIAGLSTVASSGSYNDLTNKPTASSIGALPIDGSLPMTGNLDMGNHLISNVSDPINPSDVVTLNLLQNLVIDNGAF